MKKINFRSLTALLLVAVMLSTMLTGCAQKPSDDKTKTYGDVIFPLVEPVTLTYWIPLEANAAKIMSNYNESLVFQEMEKRTNVHIEFVHPAQGQSTEQFNLMITSGKWPDIIGMATSYNGGGEKAVQDGVYLDLTNLIEEYAPNYTAVRNSSVEIARETVGDDGLLWAIHPILQQENVAWYGPTIKKEYLDGVGMDVPVTIDDWYEVLSAIKAKYKIEAPLIFDPSATVAQESFTKCGIDKFGVFLSAYGIGPDFYKDGDTVKYGPIQPEFKEYLETMNKWYSEGLLDVDFPSRTTDNIRSMITSDKAAAMVYSIDNANNLYNSQKMEYVACQYPVLNEGDVVQYRSKDWAVSLGAVAISAKSEHPEIALAWLDYAYSEAGSLLFNFGVEGETYTMVDGTPTFTDIVMNNKDVPIESVIFKYKMHSGPQLRWGAMANPATLKNPAVLDIKKMWTENGFDLMLPPISRTADEGKTYSSVMNNVRLYQNETVIKFIMGIEPLDKFDDYVAQMKKLKIDEVVAIQQAAYDRFISR